jgi:hypothetical protein
MDVQQRIIEQAKVDMDFRQALLDNPRATIGAFLEQTLPSEMEVCVVEETPNKVYVVLPSTTTGMDKNVLDQELNREINQTMTGCSGCPPTVVGMSGDTTGSCDCNLIPSY